MCIRDSIDSTSDPDALMQYSISPDTYHSTMTELKGHEEPKGFRRPMGAEHGHGRNRKTWSSTCDVLLRIPLIPTLDFVYRAFTFSGQPFQAVLLSLSLIHIYASGYSPGCRGGRE